MTTLHIVYEANELGSLNKSDQGRPHLSLRRDGIHDSPDDSSDYCVDFLMKAFYPVSTKNYVYVYRRWRLASPQAEGVVLSTVESSSRRGWGFK